MKFKIKADFQDNLNAILRNCGYHLHPKYENSYIKRISNNGFYPRWHLYFEKKKDCLEFNLHLDQKKTSYKGYTAHSGEYEESIVKSEAKRIIQILSKYTKK